MSNRNCKVGLVQMRCSADADENLREAMDGVRRVAELGANLVCLPELFRTPYFCQAEDHANFALAESIPGPTSEAMAQLALELNVAIVVSLFEKRAQGMYHNSVVVLDADGSHLGLYRKMHIPDDPLYYEKFYFAPGDLGFKVFDCGSARAGVLICWDQWFPEAARLTAMRGAEILFYPTAIGWHPSEKAEFGQAQHDSWELIQRSHAVANGCYVVAVNRTGHEGAAGGGIEFWGQSFVADPSGQVVARASADAAEVLVVPLDLDRVEVARTHWPFFRDRRIDAYGGLTERFLDGKE